jgi:hypothetical protein
MLADLAIRHAQDQQLLFDEHGFGHHGTGDAGPASRATVASRCRNRTARSRTAQSYHLKNGAVAAVRLNRFPSNATLSGKNNCL